MANALLFDLDPGIASKTTALDTGTHGGVAGRKRERRVLSVLVIRPKEDSVIGDGGRTCCLTEFLEPSLKMLLAAVFHTAPIPFGNPGVKGPEMPPETVILIPPVYAPKVE